jgi:hypothetical protein
MLQNYSETARWFQSENEFNQLFPVAMQKLDTRHWTSLKVAKKAAEYLTDSSPAKVLDIGSGVGKFCLAAAFYQPQAQFYGIEQRETLTVCAEKAQKVLGLSNVHFTTGNFTEVDFSAYDHFYFFNSFFENLTGTDKIDQSVGHASHLFDYYNLYLNAELAKRPPGTKLVTFHSLEDEVPEGYFVVGSEMNNQLKFWLKV